MKITFLFAALFLLDFFTCFYAYLQYRLPDTEDAKFIRDCVRAHNTFRSKVNPAASSMFHMVVWAESYKAGCAVHFCNTVEHFSQVSKAAHFICNYRGNYPRKPYKAGQPCSGCSNEKCIVKLCGWEKLINYANWYPDWDAQPQPQPLWPRTPSPPVPKYIPPAEHPHCSCDQ